MEKRLLYAFGGLPIALLGLLVVLSHEQPRREPSDVAFVAPADNGSKAQGDIGKPTILPAPIDSKETTTVTAAPTVDWGPPEIDTSDRNRTKVVPVPHQPTASEAERNSGLDTSADREVAASGEKPTTESVPKVGNAVVPSSVETTPPRIAEETPLPAPAEQPSAPEIIAPAEPPIFGTETVKVAANTPNIGPEERAGRIVIQRGNTLWRLSRVIYGKGREYMTIAQANRGKIRNPSLIYPGQELIVPGASPPMKISPRRKRPLRPEEAGPSLTP
jgi:nucleoid-associated protein YgaU